MKSQDIRAKFLEFFASKGHDIVPSAPMVLKDDPTLMFVNSGMAPFKEYFLGNAQPKNNRIADSQKCLRVSGKHNDLEEVGMDTYHHTMFEMLGNWSFGDYFKKEAIAWAWELLTEVFKIDKDILYVTIFEGDRQEGLDRDVEAYDLWKQYVAEDRILNGNKQDNFWEMGDQGPCGPCSEIHVDLRSAEEKALIPGKDLVNKDHPQVVEIWNLVFMQFNRKANGSLEKLPAQHVDTGMGFERLCMVLQNKKSNYDTDVFMPIINKIGEITSTLYGKDEEKDIAIRVIADHLRAVSFAIADGQLPANSGAGYVIRRILRRAIRYGFTFLDQKEAFIYKLVNTLISEMGEAFPELEREKTLITTVIREEEQGFLRTLEQGLVLLDQVISTAKNKQVSGKKVFELYDTFGFPVDLTALILREKGFTHDEAEFAAELEAQKQRSRAATKVETGDWTVVGKEEKENFIGYDQLEASVKITRYRKVESKKEGVLYQVVLNQTPFYPEGGGQVGDKGYIVSDENKFFPILDTKKENNLIIHFLKELPKDLEATYKAVVNNEQRHQTAANHSATHLLHQALRKVLGMHVAQKGSLVRHDYLRFDFSHFSKLTATEIQEVEDEVNLKIVSGLSLEEKRNIPFQQALDEGAIALFGEKYADAVRAIRFGDSVELCGGTHVNNTRDIWYFIITSESAVASGIRRIEAITGKAAQVYLTNRRTAYSEIQANLHNTKDPVKAIEQLQEENAQLQKKVEGLLQEKIQQLKVNLKTAITLNNGISFLTAKVDLTPAAMKDLAFELGGEVNNLFLLLGAEDEGKAYLTCYISKELAASKGLNAGNIVRTLGKHIQGGGGGQPFFATAGGKNPEGLEKAFKEAETLI